jgi:hypothetical protein
MDVAFGILVLAITLAGTIVAFAAFVWAAKKDGETDLAVQRRLGVYRRTRLGR